MIDLPVEEIEELCRRYGVARLSVFGSAVSGEFDPDSSDLDLLVEFESDVEGLFDAYFDLREALEELSGRAVDLVMASAVKNPFVVRSINDSRREIYAA